MTNSIAPRVIAGTAKGKRLNVPTGAKAITDRIKQSTFDLLTDQLPGAYCLDLFAGSGAMGIEALSRGAEFCEFVDYDVSAVKAIQANLEACGLQDQAQITKSNVYRFVKDIKTEFDLIFCDPPFDDRLEQFGLHKLGKIMHQNSLLIVKYPSSEELPNLATMPTIHQKHFGRNTIYIIGKKPVV